jgi:hypothetical protein
VTATATTVATTARRRTSDGDGLPKSRSVALVAGVSYLALFALGIFGNFFVREELVVPGDASATVENLAANAGLVRLAIAGFIAAFALDVVVAWALYYLFRPSEPALARLAAWFRLVYTVFLGVAVVFLFAALELATGSAGTSGLDPGARGAHAMLAVDAFDATWLVGLTCFGVHLALVGTICLRSGTAPRALGLVLVVAGAAYVIDTLAFTLLSTYADHAGVFTPLVAVPAVIAEAWFAIWLLTRAGTAHPLARSSGRR